MSSPDESTKPAEHADAAARGTAVDRDEPLGDGPLGDVRPGEQAQEAASDDGDAGDVSVPDGAPAEEVFELPRRRGRSPVLSLVVIAFGVYLLASMFEDFRFFLRSREPVDLGHVGELLVDGHMPAGIDNQYVVLRGTPDVQHAARLTAKDRYIGYVRIKEAGGELFAAIPRPKHEPMTNTFEGVFRGRLRKLADVSTYPWVKQFFDNERIEKVLDVEPDMLRQALQAGAGGSLAIETHEGRVELGENDRIALVFTDPEVTVQLGKASFPSVAEARAAVESLGVPFAHVERNNSMFHTFVARIPEERQQVLQDRLDALAGVGAGNRDPKLGAIVLPRSYTALVPANALQLRGDVLVFPRTPGTDRPPQFEVDAGKLVAKPLADGNVEMPISLLRAVRVERPIFVDPDAYVILVGVEPGAELKTALLWLVAFGLVLVNVFTWVLLWRKRRR